MKITWHIVSIRKRTLQNFRVKPNHTPIKTDPLQAKAKKSQGFQH
jgi:hypothetical protein